MELEKHRSSAIIFLEIPNWWYSNHFSQENIWNRRLGALTVDVTKGKKWNITIQLGELFGFCWICLPDVKMSFTGLHVWTLGPQLAALLGEVVAPGCRGGTLLAGLWGLSGLLPDVWGHKFPPGCTETPLKCEPSLLGWVLSESLEQ